MQQIYTILKTNILSLFINVFHKGKYVNEKKDRGTVMHIENFIKPLYRVFLTDLFLFNLKKSILLHLVLSKNHVCFPRA